MKRRETAPRAGFALIAVVLVLAALLLLCTPFLMTARNADRGSARFVDRSEARVALDSAARRARGVLGASHPGVDPTPGHDSLAELTVDNDFDASFLDANDTHGVMWDLEVEDVAARVDVNSAPPQVFANLIGGVTHLARAAEASANELRVTSTIGFPPEGFLWVSGELVGYGGAEAASFGPLVRGLGVEEGQSDLSPCAPLTARPHPLGTAVMDQATWALAGWRIMTPDGAFRPYDTFERLEEASDFALLGDIGTDALAELRLRGSIYGGVRAGARWQRPVRLTARIDGGSDGCLVRIDDGRFFNAGTTVEISDGVTTELGLVRYAGTGGLYLMSPLVNDYEPFETQVRALARRPVNVNTASPPVLKALFENLQLRGRSARITAGEAERLVEVVVVSRPFLGLEDFLRRVVLPAAGLEPLPADAAVVPLAFADAVGDPGAAARGAFLDRDDAVALYKNALNANDNELAFSTMPFAFTSRDVYALELRASVNAPSGIERGVAVRENVELVVPQRELFAVWTRQSDLDEAPRFDRDASGWVTGPNNTARFDPAYASGEATWPTHARAHLGRFDTQPSIDPLAATESAPTHTFGSREEDGWVQPRPARVDEVDQREGHVLHFDDEARDVEGRYLPDAPLSLDPASDLVEWTDGSGFLRPLTFSAWIRARSLVDGASFLDVGGPFPDSDRVSLLVEEGDLVLRVLDAGGDHPQTGFRERGEVRYELAPGEGPGFPLDTWMHVAAEVRGNRPEQLALLVDGRASGRTQGRTRLLAGLSEGDGTIVVESTEGFPDRCVLRIGEEVVEAVRTSESTFQARHELQGPGAGYGGRLARERFLLTAVGDQVVAVPEDDQKQTNHAAGTTVTRYGYSLPLQERIPASVGRLTGGLGPFAVARATGIVVGGGAETGPSMEPIQLQIAGETDPFVRGYGMDGTQASRVTGLVLTAADGAGNVMEAFSRTGGYAAIFGPSFDDGLGGSLITTSGAPLGGIEIVRYTGWVGNQLTIQRGTQVAGGLRNLAGSPIGGSNAYIIEWNTIFAGQETWNDRLDMQTFVVPISLPANVDGSSLGFLEAAAGQSEFAQITRVGGEVGLTEWVRYDEIVGGELVRDDPTVLQEVHATLNSATQAFTPVTGGGPGNPVDPHGGKQPVEPLSVRLPAVLAPLAVREPLALAQDDAASGWQPTLGLSELDAQPLTRAVASVFRFRGVLGTYTHGHPDGTPVLPVCRAEAFDRNGAWPGTGDEVMLLDGGPSQPAWPAVVQHAWRPHPRDERHVRHSWTPGGSLTATPGPTTIEPEIGFRFDAIYFALREPAPVPILPLPVPGAPTAGLDTRRAARVTLFPSGELPRLAAGVTLGGATSGIGVVPEATIDEVVFGAPTTLSPSGEEFVLADRLDAGAQLATLEPNVLRWPSGDVDVGQLVLAGLPRDAALLQIGEEILCYSSLDPGTGELQIPVGGRGLLGTQPQAHAPGESVLHLSEWRVSVLTGNVGREDAELPLFDVDGFPREGTVLVGRELIHYTHLRGLVLSMPRASVQPGARDRSGTGLFRGRYGTEPVEHPSGTPVVLFPIRYWDRWAERADTPELQYFGLAAEQPGAFWRSAFWQTELAPSGPLLAALQRSDASVPWDADPSTTPGLASLDLSSPGRDDDAGVPTVVPLDLQTGRVEWRFFVRHEPGSFDPDFGRSHAWKGAPRLDLFGVDYFGPGRILRSVDR